MSKIFGPDQPRGVPGWLRRLLPGAFLGSDIHSTRGPRERGDCAQCGKHAEVFAWRDQRRCQACIDAELR